MLSFEESEAEVKVDENENDEFNERFYSESSIHC